MTDPREKEVNQNKTIVLDEDAFLLSDEVSSGWEDIVAGYFNSLGE